MSIRSPEGHNNRLETDKLQPEETAPPAKPARGGDPFIAKPD